MPCITPLLAVLALQPQTAAPAAPAAPTVPVLHETALLAPPGPVVSPTFGLVVAWADRAPLVTGPVRSRQGGFDGQVATFERKDGGWVARKEMPGIDGFRAGDLAFQKIAAAPGLFATQVERRAALRSDVVVFEPSPTPAGWARAGTLTTPGGQEAPAFGSAIATNGTFVLASDVDTRMMQGKPEVLSPTPAVHAFAKDGAGKWTRTSVIRRDPKGVSTWFGCSLSLDGDLLAVGSPKAMLPVAGDPLRLADEALVCLYRREGGDFKQVGEVKGTSVTPFVGFGTQVVLRGDLLVVLATEATGPGRKVFVFRRADGAWVPDGELVCAGGMDVGAGWGAGLAIAGERILVGAPNATLPGGPERGGAVCVFQRKDGAWAETLRLLPQAKSAPAGFGGGIAVQGDQVLVNRTRNERAGVDPGGAYLFTLPAP